MAVGEAVGLPYSALVLLFGDLFVKAGRGGWDLSWRGARVDGEALAKAALTAALASLAQERYVYLGVAVRRGFLRKAEAVLVELGSRTPPEGLGGLEGTLWRELSRRSGAIWADDLVRALVGGGVPYPDFVILARITDYLTEKGYFTRKSLGGFDLSLGGLALARPQYELEPSLALIGAAEGWARSAKANLEAFAARNPLLWEKLHSLI